MTAFVTTRWSVIRAARSSSGQARQALGELCAIYRPAVIAFLRRFRLDGMDSEDAAQEFFAGFLHSDLVHRVDPDKGSFRSYLITALRHFVGRQLEMRASSKRGSTPIHDQLDAAASVADSSATPEEQFDRSWAQLILERALLRLRAEAEAAGKQALFDRLADFLIEDADRDAYAPIAAALGMRSNSVAVAVFRLRERFRTLVRNEVLQTVDSAQQLDTELDALKAVLG